MEQRTLGRTHRTVSAIGLGTWQLGADWGEVSEEQALDVLAAAVDAGVTLLDTADVYGDGRSEKFIGRFLRDHDGLTVATKMGRRVDQVPQNYRLDHFREWTDRSRRNLGVDTLDLVQLHCPPSATITDDATWDALDTLVDDGAIAAYGVSVETCDQALAAIARPGCASVQIILNAFRLPKECSSAVHPRLTPINTMRIVFACLGGEEPRLLEPRHFISRPDSPQRGRLRRVSVR